VRSSIPACAAGRMFEGETSRVIPWREGALGAYPFFRRALAARSFLSRDLKERAAHSTMWREPVSASDASPK
jgi:hypothetical protein